MQIRHTPYKAVFLKEEGDRYVVIGKKYFKAENEEIKWKEKTFPVNLKNLSFRVKNENYLFIDYENNKQLTFSKYKTPIDAKAVDLITSHNIIAQILNKLNPVGSKSGLMIFLLVLVVGLAVGYLVGQQYAPAKEVIKYVNQTIPSV